jgi:hypothetical protein
VVAASPPPQATAPGQGGVPPPAATRARCTWCRSRRSGTGRRQLPRQPRLCPAWPHSWGLCCTRWVGQVVSTGPHAALHKGTQAGACHEFNTLTVVLHVTQVEETARAIRLTNTGLAAQAAARPATRPAPLTGPELLRQVLKAGAAGKASGGAPEGPSHNSALRPRASAAAPLVSTAQHQEVEQQQSGDQQQGGGAPADDQLASPLSAFKALGEVSLAARSSCEQGSGSSGGGTQVGLSPAGAHVPQQHQQRDPLNPPLYQRIHAAYTTPHTHGVAEYAASRPHPYPDSPLNLLAGAGLQTPAAARVHLPPPGLQGGEALQGSLTVDLPAGAPPLLLAHASSPGWQPLTPNQISSGHTSAGPRAQLHSRAKAARAELLHQFVSPTVTLWPVVPGATVGEQGFTKSVEQLPWHSAPACKCWLPACTPIVCMWCSPC